MEEEIWGNDSREDNAEKLKVWLKEMGCVISEKVHYPHIFGNGLLGMVALEKIDPNETIVTIKPEAILSTELLKSNPLQVVFSAHPEYFGTENTEGIDNQFLALVIHERYKPSSKWELFFNTLPTESENLCDWEVSEICELQDQDILIDSKIRKVKNIGSYTELLKILSGFPDFFPNTLSIGDIEWCWKMIWTRSFMRSPEHSALIPYADFINHGPSDTGFYFLDQKAEECEGEASIMDTDEMHYEDKICKLTCQNLYEINFLQYDDLSPQLMEAARIIAIESQAIDKADREKKNKSKPKEDLSNNSDFVIVTGDKETYHPSSQIMFEYGNYSNTSLLIHYGFTIPNNRSEYFRLKIPLKKVLNKKQRVNLPTKYNPDSVLLFYLNKQGICQELLRTLRALMWNPFYKKNSFFSQTDLELERKILLKYQSFVLKSLKNFPTRIDEDIRISPKSVRHHFAITYRILKKQIVHLQVDLVKSALDIVDKFSNGLYTEDFIDNHLERELKPYIQCIEFYKSKESCNTQSN